MKQELNTLITGAMKSGNKKELNVFRLIKAEFTKFETAENAKELTNEAEIKILNKMVKDREESVRQYTLANREDLASEELSEIEVIKKFLPEDATEEEVTTYSLELISSNPGKNMGDYIKMIKSKYPTANGKLIADIVKSKLI